MKVSCVATGNLEAELESAWQCVCSFGPLTHSRHKVYINYITKFYALKCFLTLTMYKRCYTKMFALLCPAFGQYVDPM